MAIGYKISQLTALDETLSANDLLEIENISKAVGLKSQKIRVEQLQFTPVEVTGNYAIPESGVYCYTGTGGHTMTIPDELTYVSICSESSNGSDVALSGNLPTVFGGSITYGNPALIFRWSSFLNKYIM
jgi:hypothetical protein